MKPGTLTLAAGPNVNAEIALRHMNIDRRIKESLGSTGRSIAADHGIAAIVSEVSDDDLVISPHTLSPSRPKRLPRDFNGFRTENSPLSVPLQHGWVRSWKEFGEFYQRS